MEPARMGALAPGWPPLGAGVGVTVNPLRLGVDKREAEDSGVEGPELLLEGLTKTVAHALAAQNIQVNGIALGAILPNSNDADPASFAAMANSNPSGRNGDPQAVADAMLYLLTHASYVTGESIRIDGGQHLV